MVLWVLNLSRITLSKRGLCVVMGFFQAVLSTEHPQGAADSDGSALWEQGSGSLTGSPGELHTGDRGAGLWAPYAVWKVCVEEESAGTRWGVQGNDGEESVNLPSFPACSAREPGGCSCPVQAAGVGFPPPDIPTSHGVLGGTCPSPAVILGAQRSKINSCWQRILTILIEDHYRSEIFCFEGRHQAKMFKVFHMW